MDDILTFVVLSGQINVALSQQVVNTPLLSISYSIEDGRLTVVVHSIRVSSHFDQHLHDRGMALSSCVENRCLPVRVNMISFASALQKELAQFEPTIPGHVEEACLIQRILMCRIAFGLFDQVLRHLVGLLFVFDQTGCEQSILPIQSVIL